MPILACHSLKTVCLSSPFCTGDYLVTIEEKNKATYLRAYTNWRYQAAEKTRVGVRLLGHFLRGSASLRGIPKEQMEIIEIPLFEPPLCVACCPLSGDLLVGCAKSLVLFTLRKQALNDRLSVLDFERLLILHIPGWSPTQVALCAGYVALQADLEVLIFQLQRPQPGKEQQHSLGEEGNQQLQQHSLVPEDMISGTDRLSVGNTGISDSGNAPVHHTHTHTDKFCRPTNPLLNNLVF